MKGTRDFYIKDNIGHKDIILINNIVIASPFLFKNKTSKHIVGSCGFELWAGSDNDLKSRK